MRRLIIAVWIVAMATTLGAWGWFWMKKPGWSQAYEAKIDTREQEALDRKAAAREREMGLIASFAGQSEALKATMSPEAAEAYEAAVEDLKQIAQAQEILGKTLILEGESLTHIPFEVAGVDLTSIDIIDTSITDLSPLLGYLETESSARTHLGGMTIVNSPIEDFSPLYRIRLSSLRLEKMRVLGLETLIEWCHDGCDLVQVSEAGDADGQ